MAKNLELSFLLDFYGDVLTEKQREVMQQYYNDDLSLAEIAENFSITRQGVRDSIKRGEGTILELEQKIGFARRYRAVQEGVAQLEHLAREINFQNSSSYSMSEEIRRATDEMLAIIASINDAENSEE
ncbi:MAG: DNA-binding protein [Oscillospiraceae bacterium]|nr:DNA-binding protein [Oscillospiraceae bacterium]